MSAVTRFLVTFSFILILSPAVLAKEIIGWVEKARIMPGDALIKAKIDTGAMSSSMHCDCSSEFLRDGERWVKFSITDLDGKQVSVEKKVVRTVKVKRHFGDMQKRDVVRMGICIGDQYEEAEVSLIDRSGFNYDLLIGRAYLIDKFVVDPSQQFTVKPRCNDIE